VHDLRQQLAVAGEKRDNLVDQVRGLDQTLAQANARADAQEAVTTQLKALLAAAKEKE